jgi:hypothetical protein
MLHQKEHDDTNVTHECTSMPGVLHLTNTVLHQYDHGVTLPDIANVTFCTVQNVTFEPLRE